MATVAKLTENLSAIAKKIDPNRSEKHWAWRLGTTISEKRAQKYGNENLEAGINELAKACGVTPEAIKEMENGTRCLDQTQLTILADELGVQDLKALFQMAHEI